MRKPERLSNLPKDTQFNDRLRDKIQVFNSQTSLFFQVFSLLSYYLLDDFFQMPAWSASFFSLLHTSLLPGTFAPHHFLSN